MLLKVIDACTFTTLEVDSKDFDTLSTSEQFNVALQVMSAYGKQKGNEEILKEFIIDFVQRNGLTTSSFICESCGDLNRTLELSLDVDS